MGKKSTKGKELQRTRDLLPASRKLEERELTKFEDKVAWMLIEGHDVAGIARKMAPDDKKKQKALRQRIRRLAQDAVFEKEYGQRARVSTVLAVGPTIHAVAKKAKAGRVDAAKLIFEASGFHNPRVQHEHGGEIKITIRNAARPEPVVEEYIGTAEEVKDADVVE
jgi:hypothetical protein